MAHKLELEQWQQAAAMFDSGRLYESLDIFRSIADAAKIHFNMGHIYTILEDYDEAIRCFDAAIKLDQYFALAYFQRGVAYMVKEDYASALEDFNDALLYLRRNMLIDYTQLGLRFKLFACDVLYNRALCNYCRGEPEEADKDLKAAYGEQREKRHEMVEQAIKSKGKGCVLTKRG
ncbi:NADPH oxidase regulator NoxR [Ramicandelaber brevisporus]|nr:NADPH oxidase regulator NoxR [Ramicandelaber brevisporus]